MGATRTSIGRAHAGTTVTAIRDGDHVTIYSAEGQPIGYFVIDPAKTYVTLIHIHDQAL